MKLQPRKPYQKKLPLGDAVAAIAEPVANLIDETTKNFPKQFQTNLVNCAACKSEQERLNQIIPNVNPLA